MFDDEKEIRLMQKAQAGDALAIEELLKKYAPALKAAVRKVAAFIDVEDAMQIARLRFIELVLEHDTERGTLTGRVKDEITFALREASTLNNTQFNIPARTQRRFITILRKAGDDVLAGADIAEQNGMARSTFLMIHNVLVGSRSLDAGGEWLDWLYTEQDIIDLETNAMAHQALNCLDGDERYVIEAYFGFADFREFTDAEIAHALKKNKRQIRSIRQRAMLKMRRELCVLAA